MCGGGGSKERLGVIFLLDGGEGAWSNVKIITCGWRQMECEGWLMASCWSAAERAKYEESDGKVQAAAQVVFKITWAKIYLFIC